MFLTKKLKGFDRNLNSIYVWPMCWNEKSFFCHMRFLMNIRALGSGLTFDAKLATVM